MKKKNKIPQIIKEIKNYKLMEQQHAFQKSVSFSQFSTYMACPHKWSLMYKDGYYTSQSSINMTFGTAVHNTLQHMLTILYEQTGVAVDKLELEDHFQEDFYKAYKADFEKNDKKHFSSPVEMNEYYEDGVNILTQLRKKKNAYFTKKGWHLVGIEVPILIAPFKNKNILFKGFIDMVLYHEASNKFVLYDFKTSSWGWRDKEKKDDVKTSQLLLYKMFFAKQFGIDLNDIKVEFFILRRKLPEDNQYYIKHMSQFRPIAGKTKMAKALRSIEGFIEECFDEKGHKDKTHTPQPDSYNCKFCPFKDNKKLCPVGIS
jgi:CRISPR/Cas system-associated exonuclease Cas4 (RecB family)